MQSESHDPKMGNEAGSAKEISEFLSDQYILLVEQSPLVVIGWNIHFDVINSPYAAR
jgi:hypothetical protein